jgi:hypothetical protein
MASRVDRVFARSRVLGFPAALEGVDLRLGGDRVQFKSN